MSTNYAPKPTSCGFAWGEALIERVAVIKGTRVLWIQAPHGMVEVRITPKGRMRCTKVMTGKNVRDLFQQTWLNRNSAPF